MTTSREVWYHLEPGELGLAPPRLRMRLVQPDGHFLQAATNLTENFTPWETFWTMVRVLLEQEQRDPPKKLKLR